MSLFDHHLRFYLYILAALYLSTIPILYIQIPQVPGFIRSMVLPASLPLFSLSGFQSDSALKCRLYA